MKQELIDHNESPRYIQPAPEQEFGIALISDDDFLNQSTNTKDLLDFITKYTTKNFTQSSHLTTSAGYLDGLGNELVGNIQDAPHNGEMNLFGISSNDGLPGSLHLESREGPSRPSTPLNQTSTSKLEL